MTSECLLLVEFCIEEALGRLALRIGFEVAREDDDSLDMGESGVNSLDEFLPEGSGATSDYDYHGCIFILSEFLDLSDIPGDIGFAFHPIE